MKLYSFYYICNMINRIIQKKLLEFLEYYPVITVTGPRQSGKTTIVKNTFKDLPYVSLETPEIRERAIEEPRIFLENYPKGVILDEIQKAPQLFSYIQDIVDNNDDVKFILSGSQNFLLLEQISQSLAGRTAIFKLLPFSLAELKGTNYEINNVYEYIYKGSYPRLYDKNIPINNYYADYIQTYVERDVRTILNIENLKSFTLFIKLCAGRIGQLLNLNSLASDSGIAFNTAKKWISILEASYILYTLQPHHNNFKKRLVKSPKLYFYDTGLACSLLNIKSKDQLETHYARGNVFENFVINELMKTEFNNGSTSNLYFWRNNHGKEIDCIIEKADKLIPIEIKSGKSYSKDFFNNLTYWNKISETSIDNNFVIYGGNESLKVKNGNLVSWNDLVKIPVIE